MSGWWSGKSNGIKFDEIEVLCTVLDRHVGDLMIPECQIKPAMAETKQARAVGQTRTITLRTGATRSLPQR